MNSQLLDSELRTRAADAVRQVRQGGKINPGDQHFAERVLSTVGQRMDEIAIVEPTTTWEAAYKQLRREVGGAA